LSHCASDCGEEHKCCKFHENFSLAMQVDCQSFGPTFVTLRSWCTEVVGQSFRIAAGKSVVSQASRLTLGPKNDRSEILAN
jgi:hypothetical protein